MVELYPYQTKYLDNLPCNVVMTAEVGLGKTILALEHYRRYNAGNRLIIVAPASKVRTGDWQREIERFFDTTPEHQVMSYNMFAKRWKEFAETNATIIFDECHFICNATAKRSKAAIKVAQSVNQWIGLSATALPNGWRSAETYAVLTGLVRNKTAFVNRFVLIDRSRGFPLILGYREKPTLEQWWSHISKPLKREGDQHLPSQSIGLTPAMSASATRIYEKALNKRLYTVNGEDEMLDNPSKLFVTLRQIPNPARIDALENVIEGTDEHVVVFYNFNSERTAILELLATNFKDRTVYEQSGHKSELPAREDWGKLKPSVTIVQYQSGSQAIELTYASVTVYLSPPTSYANYEQSKGRTRRNGQEKTTLFYHIAAEGSLDRHIWGIISQKKSFSTDLMQKLLDIN